MKIVHANIRHFGFSPCKNIFLVLVPVNIKKNWFWSLVFCFSPCKIDSYWIWSL